MASGFRQDAFRDDAVGEPVQVQRPATGEMVEMTARWLFCASGYYRYDEGFTPPLAGLDDWYVERQLRKFRAGVRGKAAGDPIGPVMQAMSMTLQPGEIGDIAAYVHSLPR